MRALMVSANKEQINLLTPPLGLACVAAAAQRAGHEVKMVDLMGENDTTAIIKEAIGVFQPDIIGISVRNIDDQNMESPKVFLDQARELVAACRSFSKAPIVLGGAGYSIFPESALEYLGADIGIQGEGEDSFPVLLEHIEQNRPLSGLPNLYLRGRGLQGARRFTRNLDSFLLPDPLQLPTFIYEGEDFWLPVQTRRGCPMKCGYCSTETIEGCLVRKRSPQVIVQWLARWVEAGISRFHFVDNTFNLPPSYALTLCSQIIDAGLKISWRCILYPGNVDEKLVRMMAKAGCKEASLGFESGCKRILKGMNKRFNLSHIRRTSRMLAGNGISQMGFLLLGGPDETKTSVEESLSFADSLRLNALKVTIGIRIYPHTRLAAIASEEGMIAEDDNLLFPRFYIVKELEAWLQKTVSRWMSERPHWHR